MELEPIVTKPSRWTWPIKVAGATFFILMLAGVSAAWWFGPALQESIAVKDPDPRRKLLYDNFVDMRKILTAFEFGRDPRLKPKIETVALIQRAMMAEKGGDLGGTHLWLALDSLSRSQRDLAAAHEREALNTLRSVAGASPDDIRLNQILVRYEELRMQAERMTVPGK